MVIGPRKVAAEMFRYKHLSVVIYSVYVVLEWYSRKLIIGSQAKLVRCDPQAAISSATASLKPCVYAGVSANSRNLEGPSVEESVFVRVPIISGDKAPRYKPSKATSHGGVPDRASRTSTSVSKSRSISTCDSAKYFSLVSDINNGTGNLEKYSNSTSFILSMLNTRSKAARVPLSRSAQLAPLELNFKPNEYR